MIWVWMCTLFKESGEGQIDSMKEYDFVVIGGGSGGYAAARTASSLGLSTAVIEGGEEVGGLCILRGCMPSKTLIESGNRYRTLRHAAEFGLSVEKIGFDAGEIISRKRRLISEFAEYRKEQLQGGRFDFIRGRAEFLDPHCLRISLHDGGERIISLRSGCIATGSEINRPSIPGIELCLISDDLLEMTSIPSSAVVLGGGPVALEMAHYLESLGSKVTILQRNTQLLTGSDRDVADALADAFRKRGIEVVCGTRLLRIEESGAGRAVHFEHGNGEERVEADLVLNALGRRPSLRGLGLEKAGVALEGHAICADLEQRTTARHLFAAGDCCGPYEVVHIAITQGEAAAKNAAALLRGGSPVTLDYRLKLFAAFTEPQMASCGMTEQEARESGMKVIKASYPFADHGKSIVKGETDGFVKLLADADSGVILGGAVVGPEASELIHEIVVAMAFHATAGQLALVPHYHPTLSEIWTYPAEELAEKVTG
jgi:pyruvate/2-oxoglutarate dehydrogenase complex dihydrolipoamide dehydrogenase (E3) component